MECAFEFIFPVQIETITYTYTHKYIHEHAYMAACYGSITVHIHIDFLRRFFLRNFSFFCFFFLCQSSTQGTNAGINRVKNTSDAHQSDILFITTIVRKLMCLHINFADSYRMLAIIKFFFKVFSIQNFVLRVIEYFDISGMFGVFQHVFAYVTQSTLTILDSRELQMGSRFTFLEASGN